MTNSDQKECCAKPSNCCPRFNCKRLALTILAVFVTIWATDFLIHGLWLAPRYVETASLWRPAGEMITWAIFLGQFMAAAFFSIIFSYGYEGRGWMEGVRYGILMGLFASANTWISYAVSPMPLDITLSWVAASVGQGIVAGIVATLIYKK